MNAQRRHARLIAVLAGVLSVSMCAMARDRIQDRAEEAQSQPVNWYTPTTADERLPWNSHDPWQDWGESYRIAGSFDSNATFAGAGGDMPSEIGLRFDGSYYGVYVGTQTSKPNSNVFGVSIYRNAGWQLYDGKDIAISAGILWPNFELRYVTDFGSVKLLNALVSMTGARAVWADFGVVDAHLVLPGIWIEPVSKDVTWIWGVSLDAGITF